MPQNCSNMSWTCLNSTPKRAFGSCLTYSSHESLYWIISLLFYFYIFKKSTLCQTLVKSISPLSMDFALHTLSCLKLHLYVQTRSEFPALGGWWWQCVLTCSSDFELHGKVNVGVLRIILFSPYILVITCYLNTSSLNTQLKLPTWVALPTQRILKWVKLSGRIIFCKIKMPFLSFSLSQSWNT